MAAAARLQRYGFDARHLRAIHSAIQREAGLVEQVLAPQLRSSNPDRVGAGLEQLDELAGLCAELTESLLVATCGAWPARRRPRRAPRSARDRSPDVAHPRRPGLPKPGIVFKDITPLLATRALAGAVDALAERVAPLRPDIVLGIESRGFIFGAGAGDPARRRLRASSASPASCRAKTCGELRARVRQRQPRDARRRDRARQARARATTCSRRAAPRARPCDLAEAVGGTVVGCAFLIELAFLGGRARLAPFPVEALISYESEG